MSYKRNLLVVLLIISLLATSSANIFAAPKSKTPVITTPPAPTLSFSPTAPTNGNVTVTIYFPSSASLKQYKLDSTGTWTTYTGPVVLTSNAYVYAQYKDVYGNLSLLGGYPITNIDKNPPIAPTFSATSTSPTNQNVSVAISFSSDSVNKLYKVGSSSVWSSYLAPLSLDKNSIVYAKASDQVGNWTEEVSYIVDNIDKTPPATPIITESNSSPTNQNVTITIDFSTDSVLKQYMLSSVGIWMDYTAPVVVLSNDTIYAKASDQAGNWTPETAYTINNIDITAPDSPVITTSTTNLTDMPVVVTLGFSSDSAVKQYKIGELGNWLDYTAPISVSSNSTIYARAYDSVGNCSVETSYTVSNIRKTVLGYTVKYYSTDKVSYNSIVANTASLNEIATATYTVDGTGALTGTAPTDQIDYSNTNGIRTKLMVSNSFNATIAKQLLESPANRQALKNNILNLLQTYNYTGVDIDIENIPASDRTYFTTFMSEIYGALKPLGYGVSVAVQPKTYDSPNATWNYAYDYQALALYSDFLMIMTYDEHYPGGTAGAIASIGWVKNVVDYALTVVPKEKIILGMAAYGYDWVGTTTKAYSINGCYNLASQNGATIYMDEATKSKYFTYTVSGVSHTVWFEDADTIAYKLDLANSKDLKGVGIWRLGLENANYWSMINSKLNK